MKTGWIIAAIIVVFVAVFILDLTVWLSKWPRSEEITIAAPQEKSSEQDEMEYEVCVLCGKKTSVPKSLNIAQRKYYIQGAGQLCPECYCGIYHTSRYMLLEDGEGEKEQNVSI